jgi:hypothetical protein
MMSSGPMPKKTRSGGSAASTRSRIAWPVASGFPRPAGIEARWRSRASHIGAYAGRRSACTDDGPAQSVE